MKSCLFSSIIFFTVLSATVHSVPIEAEELATDPSPTTVLINDNEQQNKNETDTDVEKNDLDTAATEDKEISTDYEDNIDALVQASNNQNGGNSNILEAFQQYVNQYGGGSYTPYAPIGGYPAPIGYGPLAVPLPVPAVYPSPYGVQTTYEGFLMPTPTTSTTTTTNYPLSNILSTLNPVTFFTNTLPMLMMSTVFRVLAGIISAIGMFFFSGALSNFLCNFTPICDMASNTVTFFMRRGVRSEDMGRMLSEELTPERLKQAEEFVRSAIRKYRDLQNVYPPMKKVS